MQSFNEKEFGLHLLNSEKYKTFITIAHEVLIDFPTLSTFELPEFLMKAFKKCLLRLITGLQVASSYKDGLNAMSTDFLLFLDYVNEILKFYLNLSDTAPEIQISKLRNLEDKKFLTCFLLEFLKKDKNCKIFECSDEVFHASKQPNMIEVNVFLEKIKSRFMFILRLNV